MSKIASWWSNCTAVPAPSEYDWHGNLEEEFKRAMAEAHREVEMERIMWGSNSFILISPSTVFNPK